MLFETVSDCHDASIFGILLDEKNGDFSISLRTTGDISKSLTCKKTAMLRVVDFSSQNIVSRILIFNDAESNGEAVAAQLDWMASSRDSRSYLTQKRRQELVDEVQAGHLFLVVIEPSVGAEISVLCGQLIIGG